MLSELQNCKTIYDLATLLGIPAKTLAFLLYKLPDQQKYSAKCLSKKNGKTRTINVPERRLKELQKRLSNVLYECLEEIEKKHGKRRSFGFEKGLSIFENARSHTKKRWVFNIDLEDFFPSINFGRVIGFFKKNLDFQLDPKIATLIAQIACHKNELPQGAPSSPVISNLLCGSLDYRLSKLAKKSRCDYSRYVDDITFSTNQKNFPEAIAAVDSSSQGWVVGNELLSRIRSSGFEVNATKTRMSFRRSRQIVTGLVVNQKPAAKKEMYKNSRAAIHRMMRGQVWHVDQFCNPFRLNCEDEDIKTDPFSVLEGRMSFIYQIDNKTDLRKDNAKFFNPTAIARSYSDLLFLKYFTGKSRPIILTEGLSDILYIKAAILRLAPIANLSQFDKNGDLEFLFDFYRFSAHSSRLLGLSGGSGNLSLFMERLHHFQKRLSTNVTRRPLILLLDNDQGLEGVAKTVKSKFGADISMNKNDLFYRIAAKTMIVKTPHISSSKHKSCIEDFLDQKVVKEIIDGKSFSNKDKYDISKHYGKTILSKNLYNNRDNYSFDKLKVFWTE